MTLGEGKDKVYMLLDEHSAGGSIEHDDDIEAKIAAFFDIAQKRLANIKRIVRTAEIRLEPGKELYNMPADFSGLYRIWKDGRVSTRRYAWVAGKLKRPERETGVITVEYFATPATITAETPDEYAFEIAEDAAQCMPFFVAAQQLSVDLVSDGSGLLATYNQMVYELDTTFPGQDNGGARQTFYRGWR